MDDFNKAIENNNGQADAFFNRGNLHAKLGNTQVAMEDYQKAKALYFDQGKQGGYLRVSIMMTRLQQEFPAAAFTR